MGCCCKKRQHIESLLDQDSESSEIIEKDTTETQLSQLSEIKIKINLDSFEIIKLLGKGTYGKVLLVKLKSKESYYAMKILNKKHLKMKKQEIHTKNERDFMVKISSPFIVNIRFAFQDDKNLYLVTDFMQGGELFFHLKNKKHFSEELVRFYATELVLAISDIHKENAIYRDLKPENILLDKYGHIKLTDFGLCKILKENEKTFTLCGTMQYIAPEVLLHNGYKKEVDWWSLGCVIFDLLEGRVPFNPPKGCQMNISFYKKPLRFKHTNSDNAKNFIKSLLVFEPEKRLGYGKNGINDIKNHPFFKGVDWDKAFNKEYKPPFVPDLKDDLDLKYFDSEFTQEQIDLNNIKNSQTFNKKQKNDIEKITDLNYQNFSFVENEIGQELLKDDDDEENV